MAPTLGSYLGSLFSSSYSSSSPFGAYELSRRQNPAASTTKDGREWVKGAGTVNPEDFNNKAVFMLFGFLGVGLVVSALWFFFWAKNGGFRFQKGDWEDYKSTVLRRKGKDGKTLSNATRRSELFGSEPTETIADESVRGDYDREDFAHQHAKKGKQDDDVRRYRHEKPAKVGGLNRRADGSYWDQTNSDRSEFSAAVPEMRENQHATASATLKVEKKKKEKEERAKAKGGFFGGSKAEAPSGSGSAGRAKSKPRQVSAAYSFVEGDDSTVSGDTSYLNEQRRQRQAEHHRQHRSSHYEYHRGSSRSPKKSYRDNDTYISEPSTATTASMAYGDASTVSAVSEADTGTKSYPHYIAGVSKSRAPTEPSYAGTRATHSPSPSRVRAGRDRRAAAGTPVSAAASRRRDSLSDSD